MAIPADRAAQEAENAGVRLHQDATIYASLLEPGEHVTHALAEGRRAYLFVTAGELTVNAEILRAGDQARITDERVLHLAASRTADFLLLDLP